MLYSSTSAVSCVARGRAKDQGYARAAHLVLAGLCVVCGCEVVTAMVACGHSKDVKMGFCESFKPPALPIKPVTTPLCPRALAPSTRAHPGSLAAAVPPTDINNCICKEQGLSSEFADKVYTATTQMMADQNWDGVKIDSCSQSVSVHGCAVRHAAGMLRGCSRGGGGGGEKARESE